MKGNVARSVTTTEFEDVMKELQRAAERRLQEELPHARGARRTRLLKLFKGETNFVWSMDNPIIHTAADLAPLGISTDDIAPLPPASGDMHRPIEHVHGILERAMQKWLLSNTAPDVPSLKAALSSLFFSMITADGVSRDVAKLGQLWDAIVAAGGAYVDRRLR
jgi:hypothetical protein